MKTTNIHVRHTLLNLHSIHGVGFPE